MKNNKILKFFTSILIISFLFTSFATAASPVVKDETVYVTLDHNGKESQKTSSIWLHSDKVLKDIEDKSNLNNIKNIKGNDKPEKKDDKLIWNIDDKEIFYQGKTDKSLPISFDINYFLDNKKLNPENILGKSGDLKIEIKVSNNHKVNNLYVPYIVTSVITLPTDKFTNIKTNTGKVLSEGNNNIISFVTIPGLKESLALDNNIIDLPNKLIINAEVKDFEMNSIYSTILTQLPEIEKIDEKDNINSLLEGIDKIKNSSNQLTSASEKLYQGQNDLNDGLNTFMNGVMDLGSGSNTLKNGLDKLENGMSSSKDGSEKISKGANKLSDSTNELGKGIEALGKGTSEFGKKAVEFSSSAQEISKGLKDIPENTNKLNSGMNLIIENTGKIHDIQTQLTSGLEQSTKASNELISAKKAENEGIQQLKLTINKLNEIIKSLEGAPGQEATIEALTTIMNTQQSALEQLENGGNDILTGLNQLNKGLNKSKSVSSELSTGLNSINENQGNVSRGISQLEEGTKSLGTYSDKLFEASKQLNDGAESIHDNSQLLVEGFYKFEKGSNDLATSTKTLSTALGSLKGGTQELVNGSEKLSNGGSLLIENSGKLISGSEELVKNSNKFKDSMNEFNEEGIDKISSKIKPLTLDIEKTLDNKDKLIKLSKENTSFSGISNNMEGELKFILKTPELKQKDTSDNKTINTENENKSQGFKEWIKNLFRN
ncbi:hypothetical protein [Senegalia massiliensis]|uniref:Uncharacterized protein n=1 Tax=Senegalia massiliensis TaxID=1720316 RepID=A0A845R2G7_9CLOT|nr:hypothetical protein [Senegalia massiliensis]NBI07758.1 hypothetical protein [Senegalia massiliensis]